MFADCSMANMTPSELKAALKEGLAEWLDQKLADVGKWTLRGLAAMGLALLAFLILTSNGWGPK